MILEVSQKQNYIFSSNELKENAKRSAIINYVTSSLFFNDVAGDLYNEDENYVYSGGGHTILQFENKECAHRFAAKVTEAAIRRYEGLEIFVRQMEYNEKQQPGENLKNLSKELEKKKSMRASSFRQTAFGFEQLDEITYKPVLSKDDQTNTKYMDLEYGLKAEEEWEYPVQFEKIVFDAEIAEGIDDNFLSVIHIDGNSMGSRVDEIYQKETMNWQACCESLRNFSHCIQQDFEESFSEMVKEIMNQGHKSAVLPVRPVILAGDDVCFVTAGSIGLECARIFLEKLSSKTNKEDGKNYSACAGVAIVHRKYPFHLAYDLAEELCSSAKKFGAEIDSSGSISAMDWHIEFGQLRDGISEIRQEYETEDGCRLELRPVVVVNPGDKQTDPVRDYGFFRTICEALQKERGDIPRSKMKEWRTALKQGELETEYFLHDKQITDILYKGFAAMHRSEEEKNQHYINILNKKEDMVTDPFRTYGEVKRSIFFDPIEMMDHAVFFQEVTE